MASPRPVALITGASSGMGRVTALSLAEAGFDVVGTGRNTRGLAPCPGVTFRDLDVTDDNSVASVVDGVIAQFGRIDVLVNNAGMGLAGAIEENSIPQQQKLFDVNVFGVVRMTTAVLPQMRAQQSGRIINVSSILGFMPAPYMAAYSASKHAVEGYSESIDHEVRDHNIRVLLVEPGGTRTGFDDNTPAPDTPLAVYTTQRRRANQVVAEQVNGGDDPRVVADAVVAAATDPQPRLRRPTGVKARQLSAMRRVVPTRIFDKQLRKTFKLPI